MFPFLKELSIENYRGFYEKQSMEFAIPDEHNPGSGLTVIVGPNNSGKSTIFDILINYFGNNPPKPLTKRDRNNAESKTTLRLGDTGGTAWVSGNAIQTPHGTEGGYSYPKLMSYINMKNDWDDTLNPQVKYSGYNQYATTTLTERHSANLDNLFPWALKDIFQDDDMKKKFDQILERFPTNFNKWLLDGEANKFEIQYKTERSEYHLSNQLGKGIRNYFKIIYHLLFAPDNYLLLIDEPETTFHPQAQKVLIELLAENSKKRQIIISTHSPYFLRWDDIQNGTKITKANRKKDKCELFQLTNSPDQYAAVLNLNDDWQKPQLLDHVAKELFFSDSVLFVEGQEDMSLLKKFIKENGLNINFDIFGYGSGGAQNIPHLLKMAKALGLNAGVLLDGNMGDLKKKLSDDFPNFFVQSLSTMDIRDKYKKDKDCKTTGEIDVLGMFTKKGEFKEQYKTELIAIIEGFIKHFYV